jgi:hypothetical protein
MVSSHIPIQHISTPLTSVQQTGHQNGSANGDHDQTTATACQSAINQTKEEAAYHTAIAWAKLTKAGEDAKADELKAWGENTYGETIWGAALTKAIEEAG